MIHLISRLSRTWANHRNRLPRAKSKNQLGQKGLCPLSVEDRRDKTDNRSDSYSADLVVNAPQRSQTRGRARKIVFAVPFAQQKIFFSSVGCRKKGSS